MSTSKEVSSDAPTFWSQIKENKIKPMLKNSKCNYVAYTIAIITAIVFVSLGFLDFFGLKGTAGFIASISGGGVLMMIAGIGLGIKCCRLHKFVSGKTNDAITDDFEQIWTSASRECKKSFYELQKQSAPDSQWRSNDPVHRARYVIQYQVHECLHLISQRQEALNKLFLSYKNNSFAIFEMFEVLKKEDTTIIQELLLKDDHGAIYLKAVKKQIQDYAIYFISLCNFIDIYPLGSLADEDIDRLKERVFAFKLSKFIAIQEKFLESVVIFKDHEYVGKFFEYFLNKEGPHGILDHLYNISRALSCKNYESDIDIDSNYISDYEFVFKTLLNKAKALHPDFEWDVQLREKIYNEFKGNQHNPKLKLACKYYAETKT